ncbi:hypothetical protein MSG37_04890 [Shewanella sp. 1CM18E]|uniref:hypothetical protein n=1 Tax=Shewanella sp. 1CM18E TaxID=2929169 RepID=UPI0020C1103A|nr:hypothetical protein [Shewanella sp. 1CM18E]MCK8044209.1 hypothetical protein [Shewanella sp. 1CM18E]
MKKLLLVPMIALVTACSASTHLQTVQPDVSITINKYQEFVIEPSVEHTYSTTSFGQYRFKAESEGYEPMYGLMPLKFNGGYLAADILFFAPAMFFNLREVFPFYELDLENKEVRYKKNESDEWTVYKPSQAEIERAVKYFGDS